MLIRPFSLPILLVALFCQSKELNQNFKVYRVIASGFDQIKLLKRIQLESDDNKINFWSEPYKPGQFADIMVSEDSEAGLIRQIGHMHYNVTVNDVQKLIMKTEHKSLKKRDTLFGPRLQDQPLKHEHPFERVGHSKADYSFGDYSSYSAMVRYLRTLEFYYPHLVRLIRIGTSHEGRPIEGVKVGFPVSSTTKRAVWIDGNIHAREWASSHTALFIINQLVTGWNTDEKITAYLTNLNFFIVPCLNPDGYEHSRSSVLPMVRLWRKNRSPERCVPTQWGGVRCCQGVDLNRNFGFHWAETGSSDNPCSNLYAGEYAFSEPETHAVEMFLNSPNLRGKFDAFITLHTYAQMWIHPYSHIRKKYPYDYDDVVEVAERAVKRIKEIYGTEYQVGTGADLLSPAAGGSDDWAKDYLRVKYVYLLELRPHNNIKNGFILDRSELIPTGIETLEGLKVVFDSVLKYNNIALPEAHNNYNISVTNTLDIKRLNTPKYAIFIPPSTTTSSTTTTAIVTTTSTSTSTTTTPTTTTSRSPTTTPTTTSSTTPSTTVTTTKVTRPTNKYTFVTRRLNGTTVVPVTVPSTVEVTTGPTLSTSTSELIKGLSVETRQLLSQELLKKQLMRLNSLNQMKMTETSTTTTISKVLSTTTPISTTTKESATSLSPISSTEPSTTRTSLLSSTTSPTTIPTSTTKSTCSDRKYSCAFWISADKQACELQKRFMRQNCAFSCGYCSLPS